MLPHIQENQQEYPSNYIFVIEELELVSVLYGT
jgi:hypothetical protein